MDSKNSILMYLLLLVTQQEGISCTERGKMEWPPLILLGPWQELMPAFEQSHCQQESHPTQEETLTQMVHTPVQLTTTITNYLKCWQSESS